MMLAAGGARAANEHALEPIDDLRLLLRRVGDERTPLLILFSTPGCPYCREVRRNYLLPRLRERPAALIREVDITSSRPLRDAAGATVTESALASRFNVRVVPTVLLLGPDGKPLAEPLVGIDRAGFYEARLAAALDHAVVQLRRK